MGFYLCCSMEQALVLSSCDREVSAVGWRPFCSPQMSTHTQKLSRDWHVGPICKVSTLNSGGQHCGLCCLAEKSSYGVQFFLNGINGHVGHWNVEKESFCRYKTDEKDGFTLSVLLFCFVSQSKTVCNLWCTQLSLNLNKIRIQYIRGGEKNQYLSVHEKLSILWHKVAIFFQIQKI